MAAATGARTTRLAWCSTPSTTVRSAFLFRVNPLGARYDATIRNESEVNSDWDEAWEAAAQITAFTTRATLGLSDSGEPIPIDYGAKMTGKIGGGTVGLLAVSFFERLDLPFEIHPEVTIPPGEYRFNYVYSLFRSFAGRWWSIGGDARIGSFYDGTILTISPRLTFRPSPNLVVSPAFSYNKFDLPAGSFTSNVLNTRVSYSFSDRWLTDALIQYDNVFDTVSLFARLRYIYRIGDDIYLVYRQAGNYDGFRFVGHDRSLTLKVTRSFEW